MIKKPKVTVLVTVKNSVSTMDLCISSLLEQKYKGYEVWVVDAFSTDGTYEILQEYGRKKKIKLFQVKGGPSEAYNWALERIRSEFVAFTDADCEAKGDWLEKLVGGFGENEVLATAGFCANPKRTNFLQRIIGKELEARFRQFPEFVSRAPTMNLMVKTKVARELKFDERFFVAYDTDFGYRLTVKGKMRYVPEAVIYHHHRPRLWGYFRQQRTYGRYVPKLYWKHRGRGVVGDNVSTGGMMWQLVWFGLTLLGLGLLPWTGWPLGIASGILISSYFVNAIKITSKFLEILGLMFLFLVRNMAWFLGVLGGIKNLLLRIPA